MQPASGPGARTATFAAFLVTGLGMAAWAPLVPYAKQRLELGEASLGMLLLCLGSILAMPLAGGLAARHGCRRVVRAASLTLCGDLVVLATAPSAATLALALLLFGVAIGSLDVAVNLQAVLVEQARGRPMMSGFHACFSLGGVIGAGGLSALLGAGASPVAGALGIDAAILALLAAFGHALLPSGGARGMPFFAMPRGVVLLLGGLCFAAFLAEGAMLDWSAVFLSSLRGLDPAQAGIGYALFSVAMTVGRLAGDRWVARFGAAPMLAGGALCAAVGFGIAALLPWAGAALLGFALVGLGAANIVPVLYSSLGRQDAMPAGLAVVTAIGYAGILLGPALIGFLAHALGLAAALLCVGAMLTLVAANARVATR